MRFSANRLWAVLFTVFLAVPAFAGPKNILVLGDSLSAGPGVDPDQTWPAQLQKKIDAAGLPFHVINAGVSGDTSADGLQHIDWVLRNKIDILLLELGGNDGLRGLPVEETRSNLQAIIDRTQKKYPAAQIVIAGMKMPPNMGADYTEAFARIYPNLATKNHATLIPFLLEGVGGHPELNLPDGIHPTPEGHKIVADTVWKIIQPLLQ
jgi:acyl-CoA thioesterase-1